MQKFDENKSTKTLSDHIQSCIKEQEYVLKQSGVKYVSEGEEDFVATFMVKTPQLAGPCVVSYY